VVLLAVAYLNSGHSTLSKLANYNMSVHLFIFLVSQNPNLCDYENSFHADDKILREVDTYRVRDLSM
jgi:hypothetical protein